MAEEEGGTRNPLVQAAQAVSRSRALARGYLKKKSSSRTGAWQRRYFMILPGEGGAYFLAYSKTEAADSPILASMDLAQAGAVQVVEADACQFCLQWDKLRLFAAASADECAMWVGTIRRVQAERSGRRAGGGGGGGGGAKEWGQRAAGSEGSRCCSVQ